VVYDALDEHDTRVSDFRLSFPPDDPSVPPSIRPAPLGRANARQMRLSADAATTPRCGTIQAAPIDVRVARHARALPSLADLWGRQAAPSPPSRRRATGEDGAGAPDESLRWRTAMTWLEWALGFVLLSLYITCLFTVCSMTFQKGRTVLGIVGIFAPWLWLIGAFLPAKKGSRYELAQQAVGQRQVEQAAA
jgi:hypothetical protein